MVERQISLAVSRPIYSIVVRKAKILQPSLRFAFQVPCIKFTISISLFVHQNNHLKLQWLSISDFLYSSIHFYSATSISVIEAVNSRLIGMKAGERRRSRRESELIHSCLLLVNHWQLFFRIFLNFTSLVCQSSKIYGLVYNGTFIFSR